MRCLLVIPAYRESARLPQFLPGLLEHLAATTMTAVAQCQVLVVDDGSGNEEANRLREFIESTRKNFPSLLPLHALPSNRGKGAAVHAGWQRADADCEWLRFVDADGAMAPADVS